MVARGAAVLGLVMAALAGGVGGAAGAGPEVAPGTVVVWAGTGIDDCGVGDERWPAFEDGCWFPVDLLVRPGRMVLRRWRGRAEESTPVQVGPYPYAVQRLIIQDDSKVHLSKRDLERVRGEQRRVKALWSREGPRRFALPLAAPLAELPEGGRFGARRVINGEPRSPHTGADFAAAAGTPVLAAADGVVALADDLFFSGNSVFLDHGDGLVTMYFHLSRVEVEEGQEVKRSQELGRVGSTGRATGPHLHFGVRWHGARIDPRLLLGDPARVARVGATGR
jgi:hypothetical protein